MNQSIEFAAAYAIGTRSDSNSTKSDLYLRDISQAYAQSTTSLHMTVLCTTTGKVRTERGGNRDRTHPNAKFGPTSTKPEGGFGTWYKPQAFPKKLTDDERIVIAREGHCRSCRGSGHRMSDDCCPSKSKTYLNTGPVKDVGSESESEKA